jgi:DNA processing protein
MNTTETRVRLFAAIEGGSLFWSNEIATIGADLVLEKIIGNGYQTDKNSIGFISREIKNSNSQKLLAEIAAAGASFITPESAEWPTSLNDLIAPPIALVIKGSLNSGNKVSIVGTRNPSTYGARVASEFGASFADNGWTVISGGAYGIDTAAHRGALAGEGITYAVLASGVCINYPAANDRLFNEISESGALLSEVMPNVRARPERFLARNRLIAALSLGTIVVEAAFRSGSLRTARDAAEIYRTVMAIPGPITSPTSDGCHRLIAERCAEIVTSANDAIELMSPLAGTLSSDEFR